MTRVPDRRRVLGVLGVGAAAAVAGALLSARFSREPDDVTTLRDASVTDLTGKRRSLLEWKGRVVVLNFWATWCEPCREEIPAFVQVRDKLLQSGVEFVGIAIDQAAKVAQFARAVRVSYPLLLADANGLDLMRKLGNPSGGLPFTVIIDRTGDLVFRNLGVVSRQKIEAQLLGMIRS